MLEPMEREGESNRWNFMGGFRVYKRLRVGWSEQREIAVCTSGGRESGGKSRGKMRQDLSASSSRKERHFGDFHRE